MTESFPPITGPSAVIGIDRRMSARRRHREIYNGLLAQIGATPTADMEQRVRRVAGLGLWLEQREAEIERGADVDMNAMVRVSNAQRRLLSDLGLNQRRRGRNT